MMTVPDISQCQMQMEFAFEWLHSPQCQVMQLNLNVARRVAARPWPKRGERCGWNSV